MRAEAYNSVRREIEEANKEAPAFSRIFKEMILVTSKEKPMLRAGKGTVIKKATMKLYESEVDALYASVEASARAGIDVPLPPTWSQIDVEKWLMVHATAVNAGKPIKVDADVFEQGFDSLSSTFLRNRIIGSLAASSHETIQAAASQISQDIVFTNPTLRLLAKRLIQLLAGEEGSFSPAPDPQVEIEDMIAKYSIGLGKLGDGAPGRFHDRHVVLLTGSTGGLGSYLLASLLSREDVALVYAFNRPSKTDTIQHRQRAAFEDRGLDTALLDSDKLIHILTSSKLPATSFRIGQVTGGAPRGAWSTTDWVPIIVKSSVSLARFPRREVISWLPPHGVSDAILDVAFAHEEPPLAVNLVHPRPSAWKSIMQPISEALYQKHLTPSRLPLIPFTEWVERLEEQAANTTEENAQRVPAVKLLGFMRAMAQGDAVIRRESSSSEYVSEDVEVAGSPRFATDVARRASETMRHLEPLSAVDAERWVEYWASVGMFNVQAERPNGV
ncbi:hypothetical protein JVT61DRAFT_4841 [Boletus reticuloceps]|uniref:Thioester reductase (TE) domain-containing protein n=1 Tax=Boletus reticuloceps TaxID=495285 RepID=A0A8I2YN26_9AGAM|nr:hypothetical protein JVT61DRAFT_4841 [Boletus reticuloceps]